MSTSPRLTLDRGSYCAEPPDIVAYGNRSRIVVGRYTSIAKGVRFIVDAEHYTNRVTTSPAPGEVPGTKGDIRIGSDVWIGAFATVLSGATIGDGAVVGAAAVVARDVPPYAIVVGNPARVIKHRFDPATVAKLLAIRWWDWPETWVKAAAELIWSDRVDEFVRRYVPTVEPAPHGSVGRVVAAEVQTGGGMHPLRLPISNVGLLCSVFERHAFGGLDPSWVRPAPVVLDLGAGAGVFAVYAKLAYHPDAVVHGFESDAVARELLRGNVARFAGVTAHAIASDSVGARIAGVVATWDGLALEQVDVMRVDLAGWADVLAALGTRLKRVRVVLVVIHTADDLERAASLLPGHVRSGEPNPLPGARVAKFVRADLVAVAGAGSA